MDTWSLICHRFDAKIPRGKFVKMTKILKGKSTWKLWHQFDVEISTWIWLSKSTKYRWVLHMDFLMLFRRRIDVISVLSVSIVLFPSIFCSGNLFLAFLVQCCINVISTILTLSLILELLELYPLGIFATTQINKSKAYFHLLQNDTNQSF